MTTCPRCGGSGYWDDAESKLDPRFNSVCNKDADACPRCSRFAGYDVRCSYRCPDCDGMGTTDNPSNPPAPARGAS